MLFDDNRNPVVFSLGSDMGDRKGNLERACKMLEQEIYYSALFEQQLARYVPFDMGIHVDRPPVLKSGIYEYPAWPAGSGLTDFLNMALVLLSDKAPEDLLVIAKDIEQKLGRDMEPPVYDGEGNRIYRPRPIDIDIVFYGGLVYHGDTLDIPHPLCRQRRFVLEPIAEIVPEYIDPVSGKTVKELLEKIL